MSIIKEGDKIIAHYTDNKYHIMVVDEVQWDRVKIGSKVANYDLKIPKHGEGFELHEDQRERTDINFDWYSEELERELFYRYDNYCSKCATPSGKQSKFK